MDPNTLLYGKVRGFVIWIPPHIRVPNGLLDRQIDAISLAAGLFTGQKANHRVLLKNPSEFCACRTILVRRRCARSKQRSASLGLSFGIFCPATKDVASSYSGVHIGKRYERLDLGRF